MEYPQPAPQVSPQQCPEDGKASPLPGCPRVEEIVLHLNRRALAEPNPFKVAKYREAIALLGETLQ